jgi:hypothetical protein
LSHNTFFDCLLHLSTQWWFKKKVVYFPPSHPFFKENFGAFRNPTLKKQTQFYGAKEVLLSELKTRQKFASIHSNQIKYLTHDYYLGKYGLPK